MSSNFDMAFFVYHAVLRLSSVRFFFYTCIFSFYTRGIKHDFPFINIRKVPREVLKSEGEDRDFQPSRVPKWPGECFLNDKIMFDRYYCINSAKHCGNEENIGALYFITPSYFPTRVRYAWFGPRPSTHNLARVLRDVSKSRVLTPRASLINTWLLCSFIHSN